MRRKKKTKKSTAWFVIFLKEIRDIFRDRRTLAISLLLPLVLFPSLFFSLQNHSLIDTSGDTVYVVMVERGERYLPLFRADERIRYVFREGADLGRTLSNGAADVYFHEEAIYYDNTSRISATAAQYLQALLGAGEKPVSVVSLKPLFPEDQASGRLFLSLVLPFLFTMFASTCPLPIAADLSAGEKERGSLEPLISTGATRGAIVTGKLIAVSFAGFLSVCAFFTGVIISYLTTPSLFGSEAMNFALTYQSYFTLFVLAFFLTMVFSAVELALGIMTRSTREAQLLGMPLLIVSMAAVYLASTLDIRNFSTLYLHVPLVNAALVVTELSLARIVPAHIFIVCCWLLVYAGLAAGAARYMFLREKVIFRA